MFVSLVLVLYDWYLVCMTGIEHCFASKDCAPCASYRINAAFEISHQ